MGYCDKPEVHGDGNEQAAVRPESGREKRGICAGRGPSIRPVDLPYHVLRADLAPARIGPPPGNGHHFRHATHVYHVHLLTTTSRRLANWGRWQCQSGPAISNPCCSMFGLLRFYHCMLGSSLRKLAALRCCSLEGGMWAVWAAEQTMAISGHEASGRPGRIRAIHTNVV